MSTTDQRLLLLHHWLENDLNLKGWNIAPASADASFRRYFRITHEHHSYIVMDAPPAQEDTHPFIDITQRLGAMDVHVPYIHAMNLEQGFLVLDDLGDRSYLGELHPSTVNSLYNDALACLRVIQKTETEGLPHYDEKLLQAEMALFHDWFLKQHLGIELTDEQEATLQDCFSTLTRSALEQPRVFVHRDFHSRNLMVCEDNNPGVIDYQDAVLGPVTYDPVSLLRDCYASWPRAQVEDWVLTHKTRQQDEELLDLEIDNLSYLRWFDLMGIQRHLKAIGIFSRLNHRDGKPGYLKDIPRTLAYILHVAPEHEDIRGLASLLLDLKITDRLSQ
ncbi:MAG: aminoglycoside phosphotransferase family protein [bacterium]